jgi:hypothetical protein
VSPKDIKKARAIVSLIRTKWASYFTRTNSSVALNDQDILVWDNAQLLVSAGNKRFSINNISDALFEEVCCALPQLYASLAYEDVELSEDAMTALKEILKD